MDKLQSNAGYGKQGYRGGQLPPPAIQEGEAVSAYPLDMLDDWIANMFLAWWHTPIPFPTLAEMYRKGFRAIAELAYRAGYAQAEQDNEKDTP